MQVDFKFAPGDIVKTDLNVVGTVNSAAVSRSGVRGYWVEYLTSNNEIKETYVLETQLEA